MFNLNEFRTDSNKQEKGVWIDFGGGAEFKIASLKSQGFQSDFEARTSAYTSVGRKIPKEEQEQIMVDCLAKHIVLGWKNVFDGSEEFKYSKDNALKLLKDLPEVRDMIINESKKLQNFKDEKKKAIEGN